MNLDRTLPKLSKDMDENVKNFLDRLRAPVNTYLCGNVFPAYFVSNDPDMEVAEHISQLKIPVVNKDIRLVLHRLGEGVVDEDVVDEVFDPRMKETCVLLQNCSYTNTITSPGALSILLALERLGFYSRAFGKIGVATSPAETTPKVLDPKT
jgi:hypothetical protein